MVKFERDLNSRISLHKKEATTCTNLGKRPPFTSESAVRFNLSRETSPSARDVIPTSSPVRHTGTIQATAHTLDHLSYVHTHMCTT